MNAKEQTALLEKAKSWFRDTILPNHLKNTEKLKKVIRVYRNHSFEGEAHGYSVEQCLQLCGQLFERS